MNDSVEKVQRDKEYQAQYFGFTSDDVVEGIHELVNEKLNLAIDAMVSCIKEKKNVDVTQIANDFKTIYKNASVGPLKEMEDKIHEVFSIHPSLLLPEDKDQRKQYTTDDMKKIDAENEELCEKIRKATIIEAILENVCKESEEALLEADSELKKEIYN